MKQNKTFLTANWENLILVNYEIAPDILQPYTPNETQIDLFKNKCYVSLVGFMFKNTKVLGVKLPFHINFEEVNLRFYVKHKEKRGVVFIKEIVPKPLITCVANTIYKEHYETAKMQHKSQVNKVIKHTEYSWTKKNSLQSLGVNSNLKPIKIEPNSIEYFITEHYFGYTKHNNKTFEYEVKHPTWLHYPIIDYNINIDFEMNYGQGFKFLNNSLPSSVILAQGSKISVMNKKTIAR